MKSENNLISEMPAFNAKEIYKSIAVHSAFSEVNETGEVVGFVEDEAYRSFIGYLVRIEEFVSDVLSDKDPGFRIEQRGYGKPLLRKLPLSKYYHSVIDLYNRGYRPDFEFSPYVDLFFCCCAVLELEKEGFTDPQDYSSSPKKQYELYNELLDLIRAEATKPDFKKKTRRGRENSLRNYRSASEYVDALFQYCDKRLLVLRIDFSYQQEVAKDVTVEEANEDMDHFLNNRRGNSTLFKGWVGYIRKLEWGPDKGLHFHLIIFFKGSMRYQDEYIAKIIGEYWKKITNGRGIYWNCNANKDKYWRLGVGMVRQDDVEKRKILLEDVLRYLIKPEQYLRAKKLGKGRAFVRGVMPGSSILSD